MRQSVFAEIVGGALPFVCIPDGNHVPIAKMCIRDSNDYDLAVSNVLAAVLSGVKGPVSYTHLNIDLYWLSCNSWGIKFSQFPSYIYLC